MTLSDLLAQYHLTEDDLSSELERRLSEVGPSDPSGLTEGEVSFWGAHAGLPLEQAEQPPDDSAARATTQATSLVGAAAWSLTIPQAAERLGVHRSRVSHRLSDGDLYSFRMGSQRRLPTWQFGPEGTALPGLEQVLAALPPDLHPATVEGFFHTPDPDLDGRSPRGWLAEGGDPAQVVTWAAGLDQW